MLEVLPPSAVEAAVSESAMVEAASLVMALLLEGCTFGRDDRLIDDVAEKASAPGKLKLMARSRKVAATST